MDAIWGLGLDASGGIYLAGDTFSGDFPTRNALQSSLGGQSDAFVAKLAAGGGSLLYSTYLGGSGGEEARDLAVDPAGHAHVAGATRSPNLPTTASAFSRSFSGGTVDGFAAKLGASGALVYSTYLGGAGDDEANGVAVDRSGSTYVGGVGRA